MIQGLVPAMRYSCTAPGTVRHAGLWLCCAGCGVCPVISGNFTVSLSLSMLVHNPNGIPVTLRTLYLNLALGAPLHSYCMLALSLLSCFCIQRLTSHLFPVDYAANKTLSFRDPIDDSLSGHSAHVPGWTAAEKWWNGTVCFARMCLLYVAVLVQALPRSVPATAPCAPLQGMKTRLRSGSCCNLSALNFSCLVRTFCCIWHHVWHIGLLHCAMFFHPTSSAITSGWLQYSVGSRVVVTPLSLFQQRYALPYEQQLAICGLPPLDPPMAQAVIESAEVNVPL